MNKKRNLYISLVVVSIILFIIAMTILGNTKFIAPFVIVVSIYLFVGSLIKLCRMNEKLKNMVIGTFDLLFWMP